MSVCVFCLHHEARGLPCSYGLGHEYPKPVKAAQQAKPDLKLCIHCGLHPKNPASAASACAHEYGGE